MKPAYSQHSLHISLLREAALQAVDPAAAVRRFLMPADLECKGRVIIIGAGKAGVAMTNAAIEILGDRPVLGAVAVPSLPLEKSGRVKFIRGGHPFPDAGSLSAGEEISHLLATTTKADLVLVLLSGGGSALMELPQPGLSLEDIRMANNVLLKSGADIREINCLRTPLSRLKGGGLARLARPARVLSLILSDVVGDPLDIIASGPTTPRDYSPDEIDFVLGKYSLRESLPPSVAIFYNRDPASPPDSDVEIPSAENRIIASNRDAGDAAGSAARRLGFRPAYLADDWEGEARQTGKRFAELLIHEIGHGPACCIAGGETTVTVRGNGKGGRNQEAALSAAIVLEGKPDIALATLATDGVDGPTDAAGAIVTGKTVERARQLEMDPAQYLEQNNSYPFFAALGDLILAGPTGTNVNDLWIGLVY